MKKAYKRHKTNKPIDPNKLEILVGRYATMRDLAEALGITRRQLLNYRKVLLAPEARIKQIDLLIAAEEVPALCQPASGEAVNA